MFSWPERLDRQVLVILSVHNSRVKQKTGSERAPVRVAFGLFVFFFHDHYYYFLSRAIENTLGSISGFTGDLLSDLW